MWRNRPGESSRNRPSRDSGTSACESAFRDDIAIWPDSPPPVRRTGKVDGLVDQGHPHRPNTSAMSYLLSQQRHRRSKRRLDGQRRSTDINRRKSTACPRTSPGVSRSTQRLRGTGSNKRPGPSRLFENSTRRNVCHSRPGFPLMKARGDGTTEGRANRRWHPVATWAMPQALEGSTPSTVHCA